MHSLTEYDSTARKAVAKVGFAVIQPMFLGLERAVGVAAANSVASSCLYLY